MTFPRPLRRFLRDEGASIWVETVLVLPMLLWAIMGLYVFWDSFRAMNKVQKAAYTISDMISREMVTINDAYITGMDSVMEYLIDPDQNVSLRVSSVTYSSAQTKYLIHWSRSTDTATLPALTTTTLQDVKDSIPTMSDGDYVVIVEARVTYHPVFNVGMSDTVLSQFIVTRPRFVPKVCLSGVSCS